MKWSAGSRCRKPASGELPARLQDLQALRRRHLRRLPGGLNATIATTAWSRRSASAPAAWPPRRRAPCRPKPPARPALDADAAQRAAAALRAEFKPISDMRASSAYRAEVLGNLMQRFWLESQGLQQINLESFRLEEAATP
jgi:hypothetical protein